jgi:hypothetical protein
MIFTEHLLAIGTILHSRFPFWFAFVLAMKTPLPGVALLL